MTRNLIDAYRDSRGACGQARRDAQRKYAQRKRDAARQRAIWDRALNHEQAGAKRD